MSAFLYVFLGQDCMISSFLCGDSCSRPSTSLLLVVNFFTRLLDRWIQRKWL